MSAVRRPHEGGERMNVRALQRLLIATSVLVLAAIWTGTAAAVPPDRTIMSEATQTFQSPFCGDALIVEHDVGRITYTSFFNPDGSLRAFTVHDAAVTTTLTNTETGATLTGVYSNLDATQISFDPSSGVVTLTESFNGLNILLRGTGGAPFVSAGRAVVTYRFRFDSEGNAILIDVTQVATPKMVHLTQLLCS
jgi:hypothetical protein